jgi:vacuolar-type H+-ATPase subunit H
MSRQTRRRGGRVNDNNLLEDIKKKEDDLEALLVRTKEEARRIVENAREKAREIEVAATREAEREAEQLSEKEMEAVEREVKAVLSDAKERAEGVERIAASRFDGVVRMVLDKILPGARDDSEDE